MSAAPTILLRVKTAREQTAIRNLHEARAAVARARAELDAKQKELDEYRAWRPQRERRLYDEIINQEVSLDDLEELKVKMVRLREHEEALTEQQIALERALDAAGKAEQEARAAWAVAQHEVQKVEELLADWRVREQREVERKAELELEEFSRPRGLANH